MPKVHCLNVLSVAIVGSATTHPNLEFIFNNIARILLK